MHELRFKFNGIDARRDHEAARAAFMCAFAWLNFISAALFARRIIKILRIKNDQTFSFHRDLDYLARRKL